MKKKKAMLVAYVEPTLLEQAKWTAWVEAIGFSEWVANALGEALSRKRVDAALAKLSRMEEAECQPSAMRPPKVLR